MRTTFYMVYLENQQTPAYKHESLQAAETEAKRLTELYGHKAYVLVTLKSIERVKYNIEDLRPDEKLPF